MAQHQQYIPIDDCVNAYLDESEQGVHKYFKIWQIVMRGGHELGLDFFFQIKSVKLPINANKTVTLPADCLKYSKIGVLNDRGEIIPLRFNDKLTYFADQLPDRLTKTQDNTIPNAFINNSPVWYNYWNGYAYSPVFGLPSGAPFVGSFKIDEHNGIILLDESFIYEYLMVEYVASPKQGEVYYIPIQFKEALISYIRWKDIISTNAKTHVANANIMWRRKEFYNDRRLALARFRPYYLDQAYMSNLEDTRLAIKA